METFESTDYHLNMGASEWNRYFNECHTSLVDADALSEQLAELKEDVFSDCSSFTITDILQGRTVARSIRNETDLDAAGDIPKSGIRIISINSNRTIAPLNIKSELAAEVFRRNNVRKDFLRVMLSFGIEPHKAEASSGNNAEFQGENSYTLLYKLNYVEQNKRSGQTPWSFRHVGLYHHHSSDTDLFILLHSSPTSALYTRLSQLLRPRSKDPLVVDRLKGFSKNPESIHQLALACYVDNWRLYMRHLGDQFSKINNSAMVQTADRAGDESFKRVQKLRNTIDSAMFADACCMSNLDVVSCLKASKRFGSDACQSLAAMETTLHGYVKSCKVLQDRIRNTIDLVGYTLTLHNQLETTKLDKEIRDMTKNMQGLAGETKAVTLSLERLTKHNVDDSAIVRIITIVSAFYIPGSFVGTIFGTNFFVFDPNSSQIIIATDFWIFVVSWLGLTVLTGALFYFTYFRKRIQDDNDKEPRPKV